MKKGVHTSRAQILAEILRSQREAIGLRQSEVAGRLDVPQSFVSRYESGERRIDLIELESISKALETSLESILANYLEAIR